jgi:drug/metabolite transporter (DMT)-like permease
VLLLAARALGRTLPTSARLLGRLAMLAVFGVVVNQLCFVEGLARTTATHSALINTTIPVWTLAIAVLARQERVAPRKIAALGLATIGVALVIRPASGTAASIAGDLLTLVNALSYSLFLVLSMRVLARVDAVAATATLLAFGALGMLVPCLPALAAFDPARCSRCSPPRSPWPSWESAPGRSRWPGRR